MQIYESQPDYQTGWPNAMVRRPINHYLLEFGKKPTVERWLSYLATSQGDPKALRLHIVRSPAEPDNGAESMRETSDIIASPLMSPGQTKREIRLVLTKMRIIPYIERVAFMYEGWLSGDWAWVQGDVSWSPWNHRWTGSIWQVENPSTADDPTWTWAVQFPSLPLPMVGSTEWEHPGPNHHAAGLKTIKVYDSEPGSQPDLF